jgi:hypothetical protein
MEITHENFKRITDQWRRELKQEEENELLHIKTGRSEDGGAEGGALKGSGRSAGGGYTEGVAPFKPSE